MTNEEPFFVLTHVPSIASLSARPLPDDFRRFLRWIEQIGGGAAEQWCVRLQGSLLDDYWIEHGSDLADHFTFFGRFPEGSQLAIWFPNVTAFDDGPVVLVGSEGQSEVVGANTLHFLSRLAYDDELSEQIDLIPPPDEMEPFRTDLRGWLAGDLRLDLGKARAMAQLEAGAGLPNFGDWLSEHAAAARSQCREDPSLIELHRLLGGLVEESRFAVLKPWESVEFVAVCLAERCEIREVRRPGDIPLATLTELLPLVRAYRERRVAAMPERGAWFQAWFKLHGRYDFDPPVCNFDQPPAFGHHRGRTDDPLDEPPQLDISVGDYIRELTMYPRSSRWTPPWLSDLIEIQ